MAQSFLCSAYLGIGKVARKRLEFDKATDFLSKRYQITYNWLYNSTDNLRSLHLRKFAHASSCEHLCEMFLFFEDIDNLIIYSGEFCKLMVDLKTEYPNDFNYRLSYLLSYCFVGRCYFLQKNFDESTRYLEIAFSSSTELSNELPKSFENLALRYMIVECLAELFQKQKDYDKAIAFYSEQYIIGKTLNVTNKTNKDLIFNQGNAACKLADLYVKLDRLDDAYPYLIQIVEIFENLSSGQGPNFTHVHNLYFGYDTYVEYYEKKGDWNLALEYAQKAVSTLEKMVEMVENDPNFRPRYIRLLRQCLNKAAKICETLGDKPMARKFEGRANAVK